MTVESSVLRNPKGESDIKELLVDISAIPPAELITIVAAVVVVILLADIMRGIDQEIEKDLEKDIIGIEAQDIEDTQDLHHQERETIEEEVEATMIEDIVITVSEEIDHTPEIDMMIIDTEIDLEKEDRNYEKGMRKLL